jgi:hypothetical protein
MMAAIQEPVMQHARTRIHQPLAGVRAYARPDEQTLVIQSDPTASPGAEAVRTSIQATRDERTGGAPARYHSLDDVVRRNDAHIIKGPEAISVLVKNLEQASQNEQIPARERQGITVLRENIRKRFDAHRTQQVSEIKERVQAPRQELLPWANQPVVAEADRSQSEPQPVG